MQSLEVALVLPVLHQLPVHAQHAYAYILPFKITKDTFNLYVVGSEVTSLHRRLHWFVIQGFPVHLPSFVAHAGFQGYRRHQQASFCFACSNLKTLLDVSAAAGLNCS
jgi:hypothetical protein